MAKPINTTNDAVKSLSDSQNEFLTQYNNIFIQSKGKLSGIVNTSYPQTGELERLNVVVNHANKLAFEEAYNAIEKLSEEQMEEAIRIISTYKTVENMGLKDFQNKSKQIVYLYTNHCYHCF